MSKKIKYILIFAMVALMIVPLFGCEKNPSPTDKNVSNETAVADVTDNGSVDPGVTDGTEPGTTDGTIEQPTVDPNASVNPNASAGPVVTAAPGTTGAPSGNTTQQSGGKTTTAPQPTKTSGGNATTAPKPTKVAPSYTGPYKGVVLMGFTPQMMSPHAYANNAGFYKSSKRAANFFYSENIYRNVPFDTNLKGTKYFTLLFENPGDATKDEFYAKATVGGHFPCILDMDLKDNKKGKAEANTSRGRAKNVDSAIKYVNNGTTTKIYFDVWYWDFKYGRPDIKSTIGKDEEWYNSHKLDKDQIEQIAKKTDEWLETKVMPDVKAIADAFKAKNSKVEVYVGGYYPYTNSFPRFDKTKYPGPAAFWGKDKTMNHDYNDHATTTPAIFKQHNKVIKDFCSANGYKFIDYYKSNLVNSNGYLKEDYSDPNSMGCLFNTAGLKVYGDYMLKQMGLKPFSPEY